MDARSAAIARRVAWPFGRMLLLGVTLPALTFVLFDILPADPARVVLGPNASVEAVEALRVRLGLDRPAPERLMRQYTSLLRLDWGRALSSQRPVLAEVEEKFAVSARIGALACVFSLAASYGLVALLFWVPAAWPVVSLLRAWVALPSYVTATTVALAVAALVPSFPLSGYAIVAAGPAGYVMPALLVSLYPMALLTTVLHARVQAAQATSHFRAARAWGLPDGALFHRAALRPSAAVWLAAWVNQAALIFFTTFLVEVVFSIPGVGSLLLRAVQTRDLPLLQGILMANACFFVVLSGLADLVLPLVDHRVEHA